MKIGAFIVLLLASVSSMAGPVQVRGGSVMELPDGSQLVFELSAPAQKIDSFLLNNPPRLVVDIDNAHFAGNAAGLRLHSSDIRGVRTGVRNGTSLRIVVDLADFVRGKSTIVVKDQYLLVLDVFRHERLDNQVTRYDFVTPPPVVLISPETYHQPAPMPLPVPAPVPTKPLPQLALQYEPAITKPQFQKAAAAAVVVEPPPAAVEDSPTFVPKPKPAVPERPRKLLIVLDPGHGGKDPGAIGAGRLREKDVVLQIAKRLQRMINQQPNMQAILTRKDDRFLHLYERINIARKRKADLFISLHADAFDDERASGSSVFMLSTSGASSAAARWLAQRENEADLLGGVKGNELQNVVFDMVHDAVLADSMNLADQVLAQLRHVNRLHKRRVERAGFAVLKAPDIPSILVETAFITNPHEAKRLSSTGYQEKLAQAILDGIKAYYGVRPQQQPRQEEYVQTVPSGETMHVIQRGENLHIIAQRYRVSLSDLLSANNLDLDEGNRIYVGRSLVIPRLDS